MSSDKIKNIEDNVRELGEKSNVRGTEEQLEAYNKIQNQLININSERASNLQAERIYSTLENQNNQNIAQLSELTVSPQQTVAPQQVTQLSPGTLDVLSKYGYGQPIRQISRTQNTQITPDKVIINNNTENNTTNNVQIPQQPVINPQPVQQNNNTERFKVWLNNEFARQKEQAAIREREFEKREWSLNRSNSKLMTYLEELGKGFAESLNPQRIGNIFGDQLKTLYFLLGFQYIANNWERILKGIASIENWIKNTAAYFGIGKAGKALASNGGGFVNDLKVFLGGEKGQSLKDVFLGLFESAGEMLMDRLKLFFDDRADAIKSVKFPDLWTAFKTDGIMGALKGIGLYLGDILSCLLSGKSGLSNSIKTGMERSSDSSHVGKKTGIHTGKISATDDSDIKDTSLGDAAILVGGSKSQDWLEKSDLNSEGDLSNNLAASVRQSNSLRSYLKEDKTSTIHTGSIMSGLENLKNSSKNYGKTLVGLDFFQTLGKEFGIDLSDLKGKIPIGNYKFVKVKKTDKELSDEGVVNPFWAGISKGVERGLRNEANDALGIVGDFISLTDGDVIEIPAWQAAKAFGKAQIAKWTTDTNKLELVPLSDPRPGVETEVEYNGKKIKGNTVRFCELTPEVIDAIEKKLAKKLNYDNFEIGFNDPESLRRLNNLLVEARKKKINSRFKKSRYRDLKLSSLKSDIDIESYDKTLDDLEKRQEKRHREYEKKRKKSQWGKFTNNVKEEAIGLYNNVRTGISNLLDGKSLDSPRIRLAEKISDEELRKRIIKIMNFGITDLGLTTEQAAGLVGNFMRESGLSTSIENPNGGASGLAQWLGVRKKAFEHSGKFSKEEIDSGWKYYDGPGAGKKLTEASLDEQLQFVKWEMNEIPSYKNGLKKIRESNSVDEAAANVFGYYEFSAGPEGAIKNMNDNNQDGEGSYIKGINYSRDALRVYEETGGVTNPMSLPENNIYLTRGENLEKYPGFENIVDDPINYVSNNINIPELKPRIGESSFGIGLNEDGSENTSYTPIVSNIPLKPVNLDTNLANYTVPTLDQTNFVNNKLNEIAESMKNQTEALLIYGENLQNLAIAVSSNSSGQNITINNSPVSKPQAPSYTSTPGGFGNNNIGD